LLRRGLRLPLMILRHMTRRRWLVRRSVDLARLFGLTVKVRRKHGGKCDGRCDGRQTILAVSADAGT
jgi:hypothetical protein